MTSKIRAGTMAILGVLLAATANAQTFDAYFAWGQGRVHIQESDVTPSSGASGVLFAGEVLFGGRKVGAAMEIGSTSYGATTIAIQGLVHGQLRPQQKLVPYFMAGYGHSSGTRAGNGPDLAGGVNYWLRPNVAIRGEFNRWVIRRTLYGLENMFPAAHDEYRTVRVGVTIHWDY